MSSIDLLLSEKGETESLVLEKRQIEEKLRSAAGGKDFSFMLGLCSDLSDMLEEVSDIAAKRHQKEHAAFDTKVKFYRRARRKAKDLGNFEMELVREFESKHISLEHGRRMVSIVKLLKSRDVEKARRDAEEFYLLLEMGARLELINEELSRKRVQAERARRGIVEQLSALEWLGNQPEPDLGKAGRHEQKAHLLEILQKIRLSRIYSLESMPLPKLLDEMQSYRLSELGFPAISASDAASLSSYILRSGMESKSASQLLELLSQRDERLKHELPDVAAFRRCVGGRRAFLEKVADLHATDFLSIGSNSASSFAYLSAHSEEAANAASWLAELEKTASEDSQEWERRQQIARKKAELQGAEKAGLTKSLQELEALSNILEGKVEPATQTQQAQEKKGILQSIAEFFK